MEEGSKNKRTVFVGGLGDKIDEDSLVQTFSTFGDILDVQIPNDLARDNVTITYRGFAFLTFGATLDAQDAIDNMDMNIWNGKVLRVNLARPMKGPASLGGGLGNRAIWESEEWLKDNIHSVDESTGKGAKAALRPTEGEDQPGDAGQADAMEE